MWWTWHRLLTRLDIKGRGKTCIFLKRFEFSAGFLNIYIKKEQKPKVYETKHATGSRSWTPEGARKEGKNRGGGNLQPKVCVNRQYHAWNTCVSPDLIKIKGTVSQTAHVQVINQKWSDVFMFVICETKWRQQAEDSLHSHGGRRNNTGRKKFFKFRQRKETGMGEVKKKSSTRRKYLQVVVTGQTWSHVQFNK